MKLGRRPTQARPLMRLSQFIADTPNLPRTVDYLRKTEELAGAWQVLGNDQHGDCVAVTWANDRRVTTGLLTGTVDYPPLDQVLALYRTQNPNFPADDAGMDPGVALAYLHREGGPDGVKAVAYARVDPQDEAEMDAAVGIFGGVWMSVVVQQAQYDQFRNGDPWDYVPGSATAGGHEVFVGAYSWGARNSVQAVTWGREVKFTDLYRRTCVEDAHVVIWPEHLGTRQFRAGIDRALLADYYRAVTGRALVLP